MPRSLEEILAHADELADRFVDDFEPTEVIDTDPLKGLQRAVVERSNAERNIQLWVRLARQEGESWTAIGAELGTSGEAARQRYGKKRVARPAKAAPAAARKNSVADFRTAAAARAAASGATKKTAAARKVAAKQRRIAGVKAASSQRAAGKR